MPALICSALLIIRLKINLFSSNIRLSIDQKELAFCFAYQTVIDNYPESTKRNEKKSGIKENEWNCKAAPNEHISTLGAALLFDQLVYRSSLQAVAANNLLSSP